MPASHIYPKAIKDIAFNLNGTTLRFDYQIFDNYDTGTSSQVSQTNYTYQIPVSTLSFMMITNVKLGVFEYVELNFTKTVLSFSNMEYYDIDNGDILDVSNIYNALVAALGL